MNHISKRPDCTGIQCLASGRHPIITMSSSDGSAVVINAGAGLTGERLLFSALRSQGPSRVESVILCSIDPRVGLEGCTTLMNKMRLENCLLPVIPSANQSYLEAIGDDYLIQQAAAGKTWVKNYNKAFDALRDKLTENQIKPALIQSNTPLASWNNAALSSLPRYTGKPKRFATAAQTPILAAEINGLNWLIITDTSYNAVKEIIPKDKHYDVAVVPDLSSRKSYSWWIKYILQHSSPSLLIISGEKESSNLDIKKWTEKIDTKNLTVFITAADGAVSATFDKAKTTTFKTHLTNKTLTL
jgi:beta-lactamase superfamily II metal-dependent hydrolase